MATVLPGGDRIEGLPTKSCPACAAALVAEDYEGVRVLRCPSCSGVLMSERRLRQILLTRERVGLADEARAGFSGDTQHALRCPRCRRAMEKEPLPGRAATLLMDVCRACGWIWLDGGELAIAQLAYEASPKARESEESRRRMQEVLNDPERRARLADAMTRVPDALPSEGIAWAGELLEDLLESMIFRRPPFR